MDAMDFVWNYHDYLDEIRPIINPEFLPILDELDNLYPRELIPPRSYFLNEDQMKGVMLRMILSKIKG